MNYSKEEKKKKQREAGLDFVKGAGIILVVLVHAKPFEEFGSVIQAVLNAVMLNSFYTVSGYLAHGAMQRSQANRKELIRKKAISLGRTYLAFSILTILWHLIICVGLGNTEVSDQYFGWSIILRDVFCMVSGIGIGTLWFLPVLFCTYAILILCAQMTEKYTETYQIPGLVFLFVVFFAAGQVFFSYESAGTGFFPELLGKYAKTAYRILNGTAYSILGYLLYWLWSRVKQNGKKAAMAGAVVLAWLGYWTGWKMCWESMVCAAVLLISLVLFESSLQDKLKKILRPVIFCGENSLAVMICHYLFLYPAEKALIQDIGSALPKIGQQWMLFGVNLLSTMAVVYRLGSSRIVQWLLGKENKSRWKRRDFQL